jgi:hypothetical protein
MTALLLEIENLNKSHKSYHPERINVHYEYKHAFNFTIVDTPGLPYDSETDEYAQVTDISIYLRNSVGRTTLRRAAQTCT